MAGIPDDKVQEVRERVDIVDLIGRYVDLRPQGRNFKGLCPFHEEKTPSFNVASARRGYKCFGCGASGDAITFVREMEGKGFVEAVRKLAEMYGVNLPQGITADDETRTERDAAYAIMAMAAEVYRDLLLHAPEGQVARDYQQRRGIDAELSERFRLGYAPAPTETGWDRLARSLARQGHSLQLAEKLGLVGRSRRSGSHYDRFRGRLMFPVIAPGGEVIAFSGRIIPPHDTTADGTPPPKYYNSPESLLFRKSKALFGLHAARSAIRTAGRALLVEGNVDVLALHGRGHGETVAPLGTALTAEQARLLARFTDQVVLCFDGDRAGKKAAAEALPLLLEQDLEVRIVLLPDGEDPDSIDEERFEPLLRQAKPALEVMMVRLAARAGTSPDARARALDRVVPLISKLPRSSARELYAQRAAELFGFPATRLRALLSEKSKPVPSISGPAVSLSAPVRSSPSPLPDGQAQLAALLVDAPHLAGLAERHRVEDYVTDARLAPIVRAILTGAKQGQEPVLDQLLRLVDEPEQPQVYDVVFSGSYRGPDGTELTVDPHAELEDLIDRCRQDRLKQQIKTVEDRTKAAQLEGDEQEIRKLVQHRIDLVRQYDQLRRKRALGPTGQQSSNPPPE